ncbi:ABC transporter ATP-binding protein [Phytohabitans sp. ZYX-F-186]|uniref:ABC transporter ATP-binding protein n=1 Tax=Phytohabitans maris TaxID=3071409 RepID=A0ABU0ZDV2_9ACTN|nr:ABC transporter ATP-binding protein [Phytohabitans sp. ZYX-F-186]MDQ7905217.1 ABC transporter ATP-binding protein [Phytohabitans sp. ZYX-F-186]
MSGVEIARLCKTFGGDVPAIDELSLAIEPGEMLVLLGPSGCGKTTLLRCLSGLERPDSGEISIADQRVFGDRVEVPTHRRDLGMVFQNYALWPHMSVVENVEFPLRYRGRLPREERRRRAHEALSLVECEHLGDRLPSQISGGQQQRVALARALVGEPSLILFDEPLSNLDYRLRVQLRQQIRELHRSLGFTGVYVTHDQTEAMQLGSRVVVLERGRVAQVGTPEQLFRSPKSPYVADFLGIDNRVALERKREGWLANGLPAQVADGHGLPEGRYDLFLRASDISIGTPAAMAGYGVTLAATLHDKVFAGEVTEWILQLGDTRIRAVSGHHDVAALVGERVVVGFELKSAVVFRSEASTPY